jgi:YVTN family beta-propeller protein
MHHRPISGRLRAITLAVAFMLAAALSPAAASPYLYISGGMRGTVNVIDAATGRVHDEWSIGGAPWRATLNNDHTRLYVPNAGDNTLSIFDTRSTALLHTVSLAGRPFAIAIPDDDAYIYLGLETTALSEISVVQVIDTAAGTVVGTHAVDNGRFMTVSANGATLYLQSDFNCGLVALATADFSQITANASFCNGQDGIIMSPDGSKVYVSGLLSGNVSAYDASTLDLLYSVPLPWSGGDLGSPLAISRDGHEVVVGDLANGIIAFVDIEHGVLEGTTSTCGSASGIAYSPDERFIYVTCIATYDGSIVDARTRSVIGSFEPDSTPTPVDRFVGAPPVPLYVANASSSSVVAIDPLTRVLDTPVTVGASPSAVVESRDGRTLYVANADGNTVSVVSTLTHAVLATIPVGQHPGGLALAPDGARLYVANTDADNVSIVDTLSRLVVGTITLDADTEPKALALTTDGHKLYIALSNTVYIAVYDTLAGSLLPSIYCPSGVSNIVVSSDGATAYATAGFTGDVYRIDVAADSITATWNIVTDSVVFAHPLAISPDGSRLYFGNMDYDATVPNEAALVVVDSSNGNVLSWRPLPGTPASLVVEPEGRYVYVAIPGADSVSVIDTTNFEAPQTIGGLHAPSAIALPVEALTNLLFRDGFDPPTP